MASIVKSALVVACAGASDPAGSFAVTESSYQLGGFLCGKQESKASIWYPTDLSKGPFPIVTYGHGMGGQMIPDLIESVASLGVVVVAPATSGGKCDDNHWKDMLHAIEGSKADPSLHKALQHVDWERVGIMGHSMGGFASLNGAADVLTNPSKYSFTLKAMLDSHGYIGEYSSTAPEIDIPAMFTTGSEDHASRLKGAFDLVTSKSKVLAEVQGADHMFPATNGALNPFDAHFMGCHVADLQTSCDKIYGTGQGTICKANSMTLCQVVGGPGPSPPSPSPSPPSPPPSPPSPPPSPPSPPPSPSPSPHPPHPSPSPSPSPSPDLPSETCQQCFKDGCPNLQDSGSDECTDCANSHQGPCAHSCSPFPFPKVLDWYCSKKVVV